MRPTARNLLLASLLVIAMSSHVQAFFAVPKLPEPTNNGGMEFETIDFEKPNTSTQKTVEEKKVPLVDTQKISEKFKNFLGHFTDFFSFSKPSAPTSEIPKNKSIEDIDVGIGFGSESEDENQTRPTMNRLNSKKRLI